MKWQKALSTGSVLTALALGGCAAGGASGGGSAPAPAASSSGPAATVSEEVVTGVGPSLVDSVGRTLYSPEQEADGTIHCLRSCVVFWTPLTVPAGMAPTAGPGVNGKLATLRRPEGTLQVTYDGRPLYTFTEDGRPGMANGNGFKDSFDGMDFVWHAITTTGTAPSSSTPNGPAGDNGYHY